MHTCDGCYYNNPRTGECMRECYPELERDKQREKPKGRMSFLKRLAPWNWFRKEDA